MSNLTVAEVIAKLQTFDPTLPAMVCVWENSPAVEDATQENTGRSFAIKEIEISETGGDMPGLPEQVVELNVYPENE